jgi:hypothetical protein
LVGQGYLLLLQVTLLSLVAVVAVLAWVAVAVQAGI